MSLLTTVTMGLDHSVGSVTFAMTPWSSMRCSSACTSFGCLHSWVALENNANSLFHVFQSHASLEVSKGFGGGSCSCSAVYLLGQAEVTAETDHCPLVPIFEKPLHQCPLRLQSMRLTLQRYPIKVKYKPRKEFFLADALSRFPSKVKLEEEEQLSERAELCFSLGTSFERSTGGHK